MALYLKDLFVYPIERYIPPVAKVTDVTEETVATDLREYVVTTPIERALADFLEVYAESRTAPTDKIGVWISGFFGSGKSHFAKVLSYLLTNPAVSGRPARELCPAAGRESPPRRDRRPPAPGWPARQPRDHVQHQNRGGPAGRR